MEEDVLAKNPDIVVIWVGVNDVWHGARGVAIDDYKKNITAIVDKATEAGAKVVVTTATVVVELSLATMAAYALVVLNFRAKAAIYTLILGGAILPPEVSLIPLFRVMAETGLYNTYFALILPNVAFGLPFTTFLIRAYMTGIPGEMREAALMDGAGEARIFAEVYLPLCRPILASAGLISAMRVWNEFIFALTFVESDSVKTVTIGVMSFAVALRADWGVLMAGLALSILPILATFLVMQRQFVGGLTSGAVK